MRLGVCAVTAFAFLGLAHIGAAAGKDCPSKPIQGVDQSLPCYLLSPIPNQDEEVFFATGSSSLSPEARATLARQVQVLRQYPTVLVDLVGWADTVEAPDGRDKARLGKARATTVAQYLIENGIDPERITVAGSDYARIIPTVEDEETLAEMRLVRTRTRDR